MKNSLIKLDATYITRNGSRVLITGRLPPVDGVEHAYPWMAQKYAAGLSGPVATDVMYYNDKGQREWPNHVEPHYELVALWCGGSLRMTKPEFSTVMEHMRVKWMIGKNNNGEPVGAVIIFSDVITFSMAIHFPLIHGQNETTVINYFKHVDGSDELSKRIAEHFSWRFLHNELMYTLASAVNESGGKPVYTWDGACYFTELKIREGGEYANCYIAESFTEMLESEGAACTIS